MNGWDPRQPGVVVLPSGRSVYGRSLRRPAPDGRRPDFGLYLLARRPQPMVWEAGWIQWPDFALPVDRAAAREALAAAWARALVERVEVACGGGRGRTGTALACLAVLDGVPAGQAVAYIRQRFDPRAVETPWQRRYVDRFLAP